MRVHRYLIPTLGFLCLGGPANATGPDSVSTKQLASCIQKAGAVDLAVKDCYVALANSEDARLNRNWVLLMKAVDGPKSEVGSALVTEQRAWIAYRDVAYQHYLAAGGTLNRLQGQICYTELVTRRADEIQELAEFYSETYSPN